MSKWAGFFAARWGIIGVGAFIGIFAPLLQRWGNPANMGICVACFERDIAGAVGLHRAAVVQYMRPEIIGFVLGSLIAAYAFKEFRSRAGSAPIVRFVIGAFAHGGPCSVWPAVMEMPSSDCSDSSEEYGPAHSF
jgi:YedE family putative selenium metabolism protein